MSKQDTATQFHLWGESTFAGQQALFQFGSHLGMGLVVQFIQDDLSSVLEEMDGATLLGTLVPQLPKFHVRVDAVNVLMGMKRAGLVQQVIQGGIHGVQVHFFPFPHFTRRIGFQRTFVYHFFFIVFMRLG